MGVSRATSQAAAPSDGHASPFELLEFAVSQAVSQEGAAPDAGLPELLRRTGCSRRENRRSSPPTPAKRSILR
jgi:hypothetical protein